MNLPIRESLLIIAAQPSLFELSFSLFICATIVTLLGFALLTGLLRDAGDRTFSQLGLIAALFGAVLWVTDIALSMGISPLAGQETARTGVVPGYFLPFNLTIQPLFVIYTILAFSALASYGGAILSTRLLPHWVGWVALIYALAGLVLAGFAAGNVPPFFHYLMLSVIGVLLLLRRSQVPFEQGKRQRHTFPYNRD